MSRRSLRLALPLCVLLFAACAPLPAPAPLTTPAVQHAATTVLSGTVLAPAGVIAAGGANAIAAGGGNVIGNATANFALLAVAVAPLADAEVFVADASGAALPALPSAVTDAQGRYTLSGVPLGVTVVVTTRVKTSSGRDATMQTLARTATGETRADLRLETTMVTARLIDGKQALGAFDPAAFERAVAATASQLEAGESAPDMADRQAMTARLDELAAKATELKSAVESLERTLEDRSSRTGAASPAPSLVSGVVGAVLTPSSPLVTGSVAPVVTDGLAPIVSVSLTPTSSSAAPSTPTPLLTTIVGGVVKPLPP